MSINHNTQSVSILSKEMWGGEFRFSHQLDKLLSFHITVEQARVWKCSLISPRNGVLPSISNVLPSCFFSVTQGAVRSVIWPWWK